MTESLNAFFEDEVARLREVAAEAGDAGLSAILLAVSDERVGAVLMRRISDGCPYGGAEVSDLVGHMQVVFTFGQPKERFGLVPRSILVAVDLSEARVLSVVDHHVPSRRETLRFDSMPPANLDLKAFMTEDAQVAPDRGSVQRPREDPKKNAWGPDIRWC
jgi:hypothetical protein